MTTQINSSGLPGETSVSTRMVYLLLGFLFSFHEKTMQASLQVHSFAGNESNHIRQRHQNRRRLLPSVWLLLFIIVFNFSFWDSNSRWIMRWWDHANLQFCRNIKMLKAHAVPLLSEYFTSYRCARSMTVQEFPQALLANQRKTETYSPIWACDSQYTGVSVQVNIAWSLYDV